MKHIINTLLISLLVVSCADVSEEYSDSRDDTTTNELQYINIANAKSLYIDSASRSSSRGGTQNKKLFKVTDDGAVEEVEYRNEDNETYTITNQPIAVDVVDENYIIFSFGDRGPVEPTSCYLVNKTTNEVSILGKVVRDGIEKLNQSGFAPCPLPQESRDKKILTDGKDNLYYRYYAGVNVSRYSIRKVNYSNPKNIVATQYTDDTESIANFVVDFEGNIAYNTLPSEGTDIFWIGFDGKIKYNDTDVNLTSDYYKLYLDDKLIIFDPMGNGKYIIDDGRELVTKELTTSLLIQFLLAIKCKHTFECSTQ